MNMKYKNLEELIAVIAKLRAPDGCPWDREQTHYSLRPNMLEEAYEAVDAINENNMPHLKEELGDVLLQVLLHSQIASENGDFDIEDVAKELKEKLIHRHPHVFGNAKIKTANQVKDEWDKLKAQEKTERISAMDGLSQSQAALITAMKISKRAVKQGFEWPDEKTLYECIISEFEEFKEATALKDKLHMEEEFGDILFATVNLARWNKIDAEQALIKANKKFEKRFRKMEELATKPLVEYSFDEYDKLWKAAKKDIKENERHTKHSR